MKKCTHCKGSGLERDDKLCPICNGSGQVDGFEETELKTIEDEKIYVAVSDVVEEVKMIEEKPKKKKSK